MKKVTVPKFLLIICAIFLLGFGFFCGYKTGETFTKEEIEKENKRKLKEQQKAKEEDNILIEISDENKKKILEENITYLESITDLNAVSQKSYIYSNSKTSNNDITEINKVIAILNNMDKRMNEKVTCAELNSIDATSFNECIDSEDGTNYDNILKFDQSKVNDIYKKVYGVDIKNYSLDEIKGKDICPDILYNEETHKYIVISNCNDSCSSDTLSYNYKYEEDKDNAYVYVAVGTLVCNDKIYFDYNEEKVYKDLSDNSGENEINKNNYNQFTKYKITFTKSGSNYIFKQVDKISS